MLFLAASSLVLMTCEQTTFADIYDLKITIPGEAQLFADSVSTAVVELDFGRVLPKDQEVVVTTSKGLLFAPPFTPGETSTATNTITIQPFDDWAEVLLVSHTLTPTDPVHVTVAVNDLPANMETRFQVAKPEDMQLDTETPIVSAGAEEVTIVAELFREQGFASNGIRFVPRAVLEAVDPAQADSLLWSLPEFVFSKNNEVTIPLRILRYVPGSELRVYLAPLDADIAVGEKNTLIRFE